MTTAKPTLQATAIDWAARPRYALSTDHNEPQYVAETELGERVTAALMTAAEAKATATKPTVRLYDPNMSMTAPLVELRLDWPGRRPPASWEPQATHRQRVQAQLWFKTPAAATNDQPMDELTVEGELGLLGEWLVAQLRADYRTDGKKPNFTGLAPADRGDSTANEDRIRAWRKSQQPQPDPDPPATMPKPRGTKAGKTEAKASDETGGTNTSNLPEAG